MKRASVTLFAVASLMACAVPSVVADELRPGERDLLQRLFSPCCYRETLDVHSSPIADELRVEIHQRLSRGDSADTIVASMVARFGAQILTRPPRTATSFGLFAGAGVFVALLIVLALHRNHRLLVAGRAPAERGLVGEDRQHLEDRLDDELGALD
jgi:cytochrome c-type biogenesis protein CcmH